MNQNLGPQFSPTQAADRRSRRRNLGPVSLGQDERGLTEQTPELVKAAKKQNHGGMPRDHQKFIENVRAGKKLPQHPLEHEAFSTLQKQLGAALGRPANKTDYRAHFGVETDREVREAIRRHVGLDT